MIDAVLGELAMNFGHALLRLAHTLFCIARAIFGCFRALTRALGRSFGPRLLSLAACFGVCSLGFLGSLKLALCFSRRAFRLALRITSDPLGGFLRAARNLVHVDLANTEHERLVAAHARRRHAHLIRLQLQFTRQLALRGAHVG